MIMHGHPDFAALSKCGNELSEGLKALENKILQLTMTLEEQEPRRMYDRRNEGLEMDLEVGKEIKVSVMGSVSVGWCVVRP